jgi:hypothetical protein
MTAGDSHAQVEKNREAYTAKLVYQDSDAKIVGTCSHKFDTLSKFGARGVWIGTLNRNPP